MSTQRVLVIEDEGSAREALASLLREEGFVVREAKSGKEGIEEFTTFHPDVVVCDYYLPDIDGLRVLRRMRQSTNGSVRFIMITAGLTGTDNERALRREADVFLTKPVDLERFHAVIAYERDSWNYQNATT
jgi:CheY-like chemotaxis protein